jgi:hypothetical protein
MKTIRSATAIVLLFLSSSVLAGEFALVGGWGFDWLKPNTTKCRPIAQCDAGKFKKCEFVAAGNAFGLPSSYHMCKAAGRSEYFVYASKAKCVEASRPCGRTRHSRARRPDRLPDLALTRRPAVRTALHCANSGCG